MSANLSRESRLGRRDWDAGCPSNVARQDHHLPNWLLADQLDHGSAHTSPAYLTAPLLNPDRPERLQLTVICQSICVRRYPKYNRLGEEVKMAHRTFFSFYYNDDVWRASNVRKCGALNQNDVEFIDASLWEEAETKGDAAIKKLVDDALARSTVTAVLIGENTSSRKWVTYEINESIRLGKGLFGVHVYRIKDQNGQESTQGANPLPSDYPVYLWNSDKGAENLGKWVDKAFDAANS
jgi:hypothetical protein